MIVSLGLIYIHVQDMIHFTCAALKSPQVSCIVFPCYWQLPRYNGGSCLRVGAGTANRNFKTILVAQTYT